MRILDGVDGPADNAPAPGVHDAAAEVLPLPRLVLRDVRDPELVEGAPGELALHEVVGGGNSLDPLHLGGPGKPGDSRVVHEGSNQTDADMDTTALHELGVNPTRSVGATRGDVDREKGAPQPLATHPGG